MPAAQYAREIPRRYRLEGGRCAGCSKVLFPPRDVCPACKKREIVPVQLPREGTLVTWTVIHVAPAGFALETPYVVGIVDLGEVRVTAQIADCNADELVVGTRVSAVLRRLGVEGEGGIVRYGYKFVVMREG